MKHVYVYALFLMSVFYTSCGQNKAEGTKIIIHPKTKDISTSHGPTTSVRTIRQDKKGNLLLVSREGIIRYDGKSFTNLTSKLGAHIFWDVLEDRQGNFWFATLDSGVYYDTGKSIQQFTSREGLASDGVFEIYEDKAGIIWFGTYEGASRYDGKSFRNFKMKDLPPPAHAPDSAYGVRRVKEDHLPELYEDYWMINETHHRIHTIMEDKTGKIWFGTWGDVGIYNGKTYTGLTKKYGRTLTNIRSIIEDKKGNIWLSGGSGLWRYNPSALLSTGVTTFTNLTKNIVGYVFEDSKGNIWTTSESANGEHWTLSRYDEQSLSETKPAVTEIKSGPDGLFGISEARDGSIWFGSVDGVYRYDGKAVKRL